MKRFIQIDEVSQCIIRRIGKVPVVSNVVRQQPGRVVGEAATHLFGGRQNTPESVNGPRVARTVPIRTTSRRTRGALVMAVARSLRVASDSPAVPSANSFERMTFSSSRNAFAFKATLIVLRRRSPASSLRSSIVAAFSPAAGTTAAATAAGRRAATAGPSSCRTRELPG